MPTHTPPDQPVPEDTQAPPLVFSPPHNPRLQDILPSGQSLLECTPDTRLYEAAQKMRERRISSVIVVDDQRRPLGIFTEHDALRLDFRQTENLYQQPIAQLMSQPVLTISAAAHLSDAAQLFRLRRIRHVLVVDAAQQPLGIITQTDVVMNQGIEHYLHFRPVETAFRNNTPRIPQSAPLSEAAAYMRAARTDAILVDWDNGETGIFTERDLIHLVSERSTDRAVGELASRPLISVTLNASLYRLRELMQEHRIRHVGVLQDGQVLGLISFADLLSGIELAYVDELRCALQERDKALSISRRNLQLAEKIIETSLEGVMITDAKGLIQQVNPAFVQVTGYTCEEVMGHSPSMLSSGRHDAAFYQQMWAALNQHGQWRGEIWNRRKNGEIYPELLTITALRDEQQRIIHYAALFSDISQIKASEQHIQHLAYYDALTNLPNRRLFYDRLKLAVAHAHRQQESLAVLFVDLDRFKTINDTLGHNIGDLLLREVAERLARSLREDDTVARTGGDEFLVLLSQVRTPAEVTQVCQRMLHTLEQPMRLAEHELVINASIGVAMYPEDGNDHETLIKHADVAMYRAKSRGRNTFRLFKQHMNESSQRRLLLEQALHLALDRQELSVYYQPIVDARDGRLLGAEALARWHHPTLGTISPAEFIPLSEETGLIVPIGRFIFDTVVRQLRDWQCQISIAINLSARQFSDRHLVAYITRMLTTAKIPPHLITLELTESVLMSGAQSHIEKMNALRDAGIRLSIDDFGTGYSSLAYLRLFPLDRLKIDQSFVRDMSESDDAHAIVKATISLAHSLRLSVVAEGVETQAQVQQLKALHCDCLQGYFFSKPMDPVRFSEQFLQQHLP